MSRMKPSRKILLILLLNLTMLLPGPLTLLAYNTLISRNIIAPLALFAARKDLASMIAGFSYTMLGFLATIITILFTFTSSESYAAYKRNGYLSVLFACYFETIAFLMLTAFLSLYGYSSLKTSTPFILMMMSFVNNMAQILIVATIIYNFAGNARIQQKM